jgi:hypothetical protein
MNKEAWLEINVLSQLRNKKTRYESVGFFAAPLGEGCQFDALVSFSRLFRSIN